MRSHIEHSATKSIFISSFRFQAEPMETTKLDLGNEFDCKKLSWSVNQTFDNADVAQIFWERCQWEFADLNACGFEDNVPN